MPDSCADSEIGRLVTGELPDGFPGDELARRRDGSGANRLDEFNELGHPGAPV